MIDKIFLNDILNLNEKQISKTKIRLNRHNGKIDPIDEFKENPSKLLHWNFWNNGYKRYNNSTYSIGLVDMKFDRWLLFTVAEITKDLNIINNVGYEFKELDQYRKFFGRIVVKYENKFQNMVRNAPGLIEELEVLEVLPNVFTGEDFNGYENVNLSYDQLKIALERNLTYINAFSNQKAVYLITDKNNGYLYVGSATSDKGMLLSRWKTYIKNGHGGNKGFLDIIKNPEMEFNYIKKYFQYSILENYNQKVSDDYILKREAHWKKILLSREMGYNKNL